VFVALGISASPEAGDDHTVTVQFDEGPPAVERWSGSVSYQELFAPNGIALARRLAATRRLRFTFTPYSARPVVAQFNVQGLDEHLGTVARTCGWPAQPGSGTRK
jgi:hypothetical protein